MGNRQRVVLYGDSLVLAGMGASLKAYPGIELICLAAQLNVSDLLERALNESGTQRLTRTDEP